MADVEEVLAKLKAKARPDQLEGMARYGMVSEGRLVVSIPELRKTDVLRELESKAVQKRLRRS